VIIDRRFTRRVLCAESTLGVVCCYAVAFLYERVDYTCPLLGFAHSSLGTMAHSNSNAASWRTECRGDAVGAVLLALLQVIEFFQMQWVDKILAPFVSFAFINLIDQINCLGIKRFGIFC
jgi:hypothetical protein